MSDMFESRRMEKTYLAVVAGAPKESEWTCTLPLGPDPQQFGKMRVDHSDEGKESETHFRVLQKNGRFTLIEASPLTGRTHQIRVHLAASGAPIMCDELYGRVEKGFRLGLRAVRLAYKDTFTRRPVNIIAPAQFFLEEYGFTLSEAQRNEKWSYRPPAKEKERDDTPLPSSKKAGSDLRRERSGR
jgi:23S rRNA-/tRNA-specific pseudouridylate synthase